MTIEYEAVIEGRVFQFGMGDYSKLGFVCPHYRDKWNSEDKITTCEECREILAKRLKSVLDDGPQPALKSRVELVKEKKERENADKGLETRDPNGTDQNTR